MEKITKKFIKKYEKEEKKRDKERYKFYIEMCKSIYDDRLGSKRAEHIANKIISVCGCCTLISTIAFSIALPTLFVCALPIPTALIVGMWEYRTKDTAKLIRKERKELRKNIKKIKNVIKSTNDYDIKRKSVNNILAEYKNVNPKPLDTPSNIKETVSKSSGPYSYTFNNKNRTYNSTNVVKDNKTKVKKK